jgi:predicted SpoU family rRNA methylase
MYKDKEVKKNVNNIFFINVWRKNMFDIYVTKYGTALTNILPILFKYLNTVIVTAGTFEP